MKNIRIRLVAYDAMFNFNVFFLRVFEEAFLIYLSVDKSFIVSEMVVLSKHTCGDLGSALFLKCL